VHIGSSSIFAVAVAEGLELHPIGTQKRGKLAGQPTWPAGLLTVWHAHTPIWCGNGNGVYGTTVRKRLRMNGNVRLETRHYLFAIKGVQQLLLRPAAACMPLVLQYYYMVDSNRIAVFH